MKKAVLFFLFLVFCKPLLAQEINGVVLDDKTNEPLESVSIYFDGTTIGATTNAKGVFKLR